MGLDKANVCKSIFSCGIRRKHILFYIGVMACYLELLLWFHEDWAGYRRVIIMLCLRSPLLRFSSVLLRYMFIDVYICVFDKRIGNGNSAPMTVSITNMPTDSKGQMGK